MKKFCLGTVAMMVLFTARIASAGFVLKVVWGWFIVPTFNVVKLDFGNGVGLVLMVYISKCLHRIDRNDDGALQVKSKNTLSDVLMKHLDGTGEFVFAQLMILSIAWLFQLFT